MDNNKALEERIRNVQEDLQHIRSLLEDKKKT